MLKAKVFSWGQPHYLEARLNDFFNTEKLRSDQIISVTQAESRVGDDGGQSFTVTIIYEDSPPEMLSPKKLPEYVQAAITKKEADIARYRRISKNAVEVWGVASQVCQTIEELGELIVALNKHYFRNDLSTSKAEIAGEIADVSIMLSQLRFEIGDELIDKAIEEKFDRLERKIEEEE